MKSVLIGLLLMASPVMAQVHRGNITRGNTTPQVSSSGVSGIVGTQGSVLFLSTGGVFGQQNNNLFFDEVNARLGIGTSAPQSGYAETISNGSNGALYFGGSATTISGATNLILNPPNNIYIRSPAGFNTYMDGGGRLEIGPAFVPIAAIDVANVSGDSVTLRVSSGAASLFMVSAAGNVGVGTTAPGVPLDVMAVGGVGIWIEPGAGNGALQFRNNGGSFFGTLGYVASNGGLFFGTDGTANNGICVVNNHTANGLCGGKTLVAASDIFNVSGDSVTLRVSSGSAALFMVSAAGNVGVGTTAPGALLTVYNGANAAMFGSVISSATVPSNTTLAGPGLHKLITQTGSAATTSVTWSPACPNGSAGSMFDVTHSTITANMAGAYGVSSATATWVGGPPATGDVISVDLECY